MVVKAVEEPKGLETRTHDLASHMVSQIVEVQKPGVAARGSQQPTHAAAQVARSAEVRGRARSARRARIDRIHTSLHRYKFQKGLQVGFSRIL